MKVLVTGTEGYLGCLLAPELIRDGHEVVGVDTGFYKNGWLYNGLPSTPLTLAKDIRSLTVEDLAGVPLFIKAPGQRRGATDDSAARTIDIVPTIAKLLGARVAWAAADNALQIHGGNGFALEYAISRVLCDARILNIFEGAAEIQAQVIARRLLG